MKEIIWFNTKPPKDAEEALRDIIYCYRSMMEVKHDDPSYYAVFSCFKARIDCLIVTHGNDKMRYAMRRMLLRTYEEWSKDNCCKKYPDFMKNEVLCDICVTECCYLNAMELIENTPTIQFRIIVEFMTAYDKMKGDKYNG